MGGMGGIYLYLSIAIIIIIDMMLGDLSQLLVLIMKALVSSTMMMTTTSSCAYIRVCIPIASIRGHFLVPGPLHLLLLLSSSLSDAAAVVEAGLS